MPQARRVLLASPHCLLDSSSGAAVATLDSLLCLSRWARARDGCTASDTGDCEHPPGFECCAICASKLDAVNEANFEQTLVDGGHAARSDGNLWIVRCGGRIHRHGASDKAPSSVTVSIFRTQSTRVRVWASG